MTSGSPTMVRHEQSWLPGTAAGLVAALLCVASISYVHRESPRTLVSAHGLLHTAIAQRFASTSLLATPPENPFFAGAPVPYYWFFQYCGERLAEALGVHPLHAFEWMILTAVCTVWLAAAALGRRLYGGVLPGVAVGLLVVGGTNPFGVVFLLGKTLLRGSATLRDDPNHLWGIAHPMMSAARLNDPFDLYGPPINFFVNITARPIALALVLVIALCLLLWLQRPSVAAWVSLLISTALCTAFSVVMGAPVALALSAALVVLWWLRCDREGVTVIRFLRGSALGAAAALLLGVALSAQTFSHLIFGEAERQMEFDLSPSALIRLAASGGPILVLAAFGTWRQRYRSGAYHFALLIAGVALVGAGAFLHLPVQNQCNLFQAGAVLLAVPAVGAFAPSPSWTRKRIGVTWLIVGFVFLPTTLLVMGAYLHRPSIPLAFTQDGLERVPADAPLARLYGWVRQYTPLDAVFILDPGPPFVTAVGNVPEFPALTARVLFTTYLQSYMVAPHRDAVRRREIAKRLIAGEVLANDQATYLAALRRPLYLVVESAEGTVAPASVCQRFGGAVFLDRNIVACAVDPSRAALPL